MVLKVASSGPLNGPVYYQGTWDANANNPFLQSGVGFTGEYYIVSVAGNTTLDGISNWQVGDWAIFNGATNKWEKIDGGSYGTTLNIVNDSSSNTAYNIVLTNSTGGLVDSEYIDNGHLTFNPSTKTLNIIDTTNESTPFYSAVNSYYGSSFVIGGCVANDEWIHGSILGDSAIRANSGNLALGSTSGRTIIGTKLNTSVIININGALSFGSSTPNYGSSGQVLISQGSASPVWANASPIVTSNVTVTNDTTSNTNYNVVLTSASSGNIVGVNVDSPALIFNPSTSTLKSPSVLVNNSNVSATTPPLLINSPSSSTPPIGIYSHWLYITCFDQDPDYGVYNYSLLGDSGGIGFYMSPTNTAYDRGNPVFVMNQYGAAQFGNYTGTNSGFGTAGQVLTSQGSSNVAIWTTPTNGTVVSISAGTGITATPNPITSTGTIAIANTTVTAGTYGNASAVSQVVINAQGQVTSASNVTISVSSGQVTGLGTMATQNANAVVITGGSISNVAIGAAITTKSAAYTATATDETVLANVSAGAFAITLPTAVGATGKTYIVKKIDSSANSVTVNTTSSQTIDGATSRLLTNQYDAIQVQGDGSNWFIIANTFGRNGTAGTF